MCQGSKVITVLRGEKVFLTKDYRYNHGKILAISVQCNLP